MDTKRGKEEEEAERTRKQKKGRWQKEREMYLNRGSHGYSERVSNCFPYVQPPQRKGVHLKDLLRTGHTYLFCTHQPILLGNSLEDKDHRTIRDPGEHLALLLHSAKRKLRIARLFILGFLWELKLRTILTTLIRAHIK